MSMNVLIADDDAMVLETLRRYVVYRGDAPYLASNGHAALEVLNKEPIDLVVTDIQMPGASGFELLEAIKECKPEVPVIIITGFADMERAVQAVNRGAFAFLPKPIAFENLSNKMEEAFKALLDRRRVERTLEDLKKTTADQKARLEQAKALSVSIINNIPFPVCVIDPYRCIYLANPAFQDQLAQGAAAEGQLLEAAVPLLNLHPFEPDELVDGLLDPQNASGVTLTFANEDEESVRHFHVTGVSIGPVDLGQKDTDAPLTCLFVHDVTLQVKREEEAAERQWLLSAVSNFRVLTDALVAAADFPNQVVAHFCALISRFNDVHVELTYNAEVYADGAKIKIETPYVTRSLSIGDQQIGRIALFSDNPKRVSVQEVLMDDLVDILTRRIETHEFQMGVVQSERLRALGEMAAGVAHELNQPMTGIRTFAEGLIYGLKHGWNLSEDQIKETLRDIVEQVDRAGGIIDYMRDFSRQSIDGAHTTFAISDVVQNALKLVGAQLKVHGVDLSVDLPEDLPQCVGQPRQIEQVLLNLLANARHALDARIQRHDQNNTADDWRPRLGISAKAVSGAVRLEVADTGGGIPEDLVDRIFEPFFTSKEVGEGTGLGLSISRNIVQAHNGDLWLNNRPGVGATFYLRLPCDDE